MRSINGGEVKTNIIPAARIGIITALICCSMNFLISYFFIPLPNSELSHAIGSGFSGLFSGFMAGFMGLVMYLKKSKKNQGDTI